MLKTFPSSEDGQIQLKTDDMYKIFTDSAAQKIHAKLIFFFQIATPRIVDTGSRRLPVSLTVKYVYFRLIQQQYDKTLLLLYKNCKNYKCTNLKLRSL